MIESNKDKTGALNAELRISKKVSDEVRKAQEKFGKNLATIDTLTKIMAKTSKKANEDIQTYTKETAEVQKEALDEFSLHAISEIANSSKYYSDYYKEIVDMDKEKDKKIIAENKYLQNYLRGSYVDMSSFLASVFADMGISFVNNFSAPLQETLNQIGDKLMDPDTGLMKGLSVMGDAAWKAVSSVLGAFASMLTPLAISVGTALISIAAWVGGLVAAANAAIWAWGWANTLWTFGGSLVAAGIASAALFAEIGKLTGLIKLADGGIVTSPTLAMVGEGGEPEAVIPLSKLPALMGAGAGGGGVTVEAGAFVIHGVNFSNEGQKRNVAKELASYIFGEQDSSTRATARRRF
jgi:hypothetical protein